MWKGAGAKAGSVWRVKERRFLSPPSPKARGLLSRRNCCEPYWVGDIGVEWIGVGQIGVEQV